MTNAHDGFGVLTARYRFDPADPCRVSVAVTIRIPGMRQLSFSLDEEEFIDLYSAENELPWSELVLTASEGEIDGS